ncbi:MAG TPA: YaiI/YqxD family protein [Burkholderiales bacterium]|nr:YaiI/YqxD family protein [Burkholderiales bacterium]
MHIWVDADACPVVVKEILYRAAERLQLPMTLVANKPLRTPSSRFIRTVQVARGLDVADNEIARCLEVGDLVVTADIPLAADIIARGGHALNPRGEFYTSENVREHLSMRDFMEALRGGGVQTGGPQPLDQADRKRFADQLDRFLSRSAQTLARSAAGG